MKKNILAHLLVTAMISSLLLLILLLQFTNPPSAGAFGILAVFILAYVFIVTILSFFMYIASRVIVAASRLITARKPLEVMTLKKSYYFSSVIGLAPVIVVSMQSVGPFSIYEFGLVLLLVAIGCVYVAKRTE